MWNNRTNDAVSGEPGRGNPARPGTETAVAREGIGRVSNVAVIGRGMVIKGEIKSRESLHIDGEVEGNLYMHDCRLSVSREGRLAANVKAGEIELMGVAQGDLEATSRITIRKGARLVGDLRAPGILIEEGAYVKGKIEIVNPAEPAPQVTLSPTEQRKAAMA
jgi:cytoskeletal protein CcmA (bactofilin family)